MLLQLIEINDTPDAWFYVKLDGAIVPCRSGNYEDALTLYNNVAIDPSYITTREQVLESTTV
jgi:hypothetical protein